MAQWQHSEIMFLGVLGSSPRPHLFLHEFFWNLHHEYFWTLQYLTGSKFCTSLIIWSNTLCNTARFNRFNIWKKIWYLTTHCWNLAPVSSLLHLHYNTLRKHEDFSTSCCSSSLASSSLVHFSMINTLNHSKRHNENAKLWKQVKLP
jgi:uncharacterized membrane protein